MVRSVFYFHPPPFRVDLAASVYFLWFLCPFVHPYLTLSARVSVTYSFFIPPHTHFIAVYSRTSFTLKTMLKILAVAFWPQRILSTYNAIQDLFKRAGAQNLTFCPLCDKGWLDLRPPPLPPLSWPKHLYPISPSWQESEARCHIQGVSKMKNNPSLAPSSISLPPFLLSWLKKPGIWRNVISRMPAWAAGALSGRKPHAVPLNYGAPTGTIGAELAPAAPLWNLMDLFIAFFFFPQHKLEACLIISSPLQTKVVSSLSFCLCSDSSG